MGSESTLITFFVFVGLSISYSLSAPDLISLANSIYHGDHGEIGIGNQTGRTFDPQSSLENNRVEIIEF